MSRIGRQIVLLVFASVILSVVTLTGVFLLLQTNEAVKARRAGIEATGLVLASAIADHLSQGSRQEALNVLRSITRLEHISYAAAIDKDGRRVAALGQSAMLESDIVSASDGSLATLSRGRLPVVINIVKSAQPVGKLVIVADISDLRTQLAGSAVGIILAAAAAGLLGVFAAIRLERRISGPIVSLTQAIGRIREQKNYSTKVEHQATDETGVLVDSFNSMMSEIAYRDQALERLAYFDPLTGLGNRQEFQRQLKSVLARSAGGGLQAAVMLFDLDEFKIINDSYGHTVGDAVLISVAATLKQNLAGEFHLARLGGDEFAVIAVNVETEEDIRQLLAPVIAALMRPIDIMGRQIIAGLSAGIAVLPRDGTSAGDLLRHADLALYNAKREGRGRISFYRSELDRDVQMRMELAIDLRQVIARGELEAHYQPLVNIHSGVVEGFESLIRWKHPERGYVPPGLFIPIAETNGLICDIGQWILRETCRQAREWMDSGFVVPQVSVNVSVAQIRQLDFHKQVKEAIRETRLPPGTVCLELTESLFAGATPRRVKQELENLKSGLVKLAIDDFGTGYSSLSYLQGLPFDKLKIDRAFVSGIEDNVEKRQLLRGIVDLGHALDLTVIAEGAETAGEVDLLRQMQVDQVQGYFFSKPLPAGEVMDQARRITRDFHDMFPPAGRPRVGSPLLRSA
jgi:diguanylate cyclase (GGDEF)-like protein